jgi:hypothetical protein
MNSFDIGNSWAFVDHRGTQYGVIGSRLEDFLNTADLLVHVTGAMPLRAEYMRIPRRAYVDTDPGFIQLRIANGSARDLEHLGNHTSHFSFGCNIGRPDCRIDPCGFQWHPTVQPIVTSLWPESPPAPMHAPFTTIVKWDASGHGPIEHESEIYGLKDIEFVKFKELPRMTRQPLELAMAGEAPISNLEALGWRIRSGPEVTATIESYRNYLQTSRAEWSIAKNGYVRTLGGWFSDRSAAYLACGRPVVVQDTGFKAWLPTGRGIFDFRTPEEARLAIETVNDDYPMQCRSARNLVAEYFESGKVLRVLVDTAMADPHH